MNLPKIIVLATGGTLAGAGADPRDNVGYYAAQWSIETVLASVPDWSHAAHRAGVQWQAEQVAQVDSKDMNHGVWRTLALRCAEHLADPQVRALILTHGTDTLEETAWFLHRILQRMGPTLARKAVVLTCAMRPATALAPDGPQNLRDALALASLPPQHSASGVMVVAAGTIHSARAVQKVHPYRLDALSSGDVGPLGWVEEGQVRWAKPPQPAPENEAPTMPTPAQMLALLSQHPALDWPRVDIVFSHAGADGRIVDALVASATQGVIVAATGNGSIHHALEAALQRAHAAGVQVWVTSRCPLGQIVRPHTLNTLNFQYVAGISPVKARISLMLELLIARSFPLIPQGSQ